MTEKKQIQRRRVVYLGPVGTTVLGVCLSAPMAGLGLALDRIDDAETAMALVMAVALSCAVGTWLFNMVGPMVGGLQIWLAPSRPASDDPHAPVRVCPQCGTETPRTRSFCNECDHDFDPADTSTPPKA